MKALCHFLFLTILVSCSLVTHAQQQTFVGKVKTFRQSFLTPLDAPGSDSDVAKMVSHRLTDNHTLFLKINSTKHDGTAEYFYGEVYNAKSSSFYIKIADDKVSGSIVMHEQNKFYRYSSTTEGSVYLKEENIDSVFCVGYKEEKTSKETDLSTIPPLHSARSTTPPALQSLPGAGAVLYLDFDGQTVASGLWNQQYNSGRPIVALPSTFTEDEMIQAWKLVSEDFRPFNLNVTTSEAAFNSAPANRRMRVIFTPTNNWFPYANGGVAQIGSFTWGTSIMGAETPCWVFISEALAASETASHEAGHTMHLIHRGRVPTEEYFQGQQSWGAIMGSGYGRPVVQWSKGEYPLSNNSSDDLQMITTYNGFGYRQDDHSNSSSNATSLVIEANGIVLGTKNKGVISTRDDVDVFSITTSGNPIALTVRPDPDYPNLDIMLTLRSSTGAVVATADPLTMEASINASLPAGTYYLFIDGVTGSLGANSDYASLGAYTIATQTYCSPAYTFSCTMQPLFIKSFKLNTLENTNSGCSNTTKGYTNYEPSGALTTSVARGQAFNLNIEGSPGYDQFFGVWIDFNGDKDFDDAGEFVYTSPVASLNVSTTITILTTAKPGLTGLRVRTKYDDPIAANEYCSVLRFGEAEHYTITITDGAALPIKLKDFTAHESGCTAILKWQSLEEVNADFFSVERSKNGTDFSEVGRIDSRNYKSYSYIDNTNSAGTFYYRLRLVDKDGRFSYSPVQVLKFNCTGKQKVLAYPTVTTGLVNVRLPEGLQNAQIKVLNSLGKELFNDHNKNLQRSINLGSFANGVYILQMVDQGKIIDIIKIALHR